MSATTAPVIRLSRHPLARRAGFRYRANHQGAGSRVLDPFTVAPATQERLFALLVAAAAAASLVAAAAWPAAAL